MPDEPRDWYDPGEVKPRDLVPNPRCPHCKSGGMFHPAHRWAPCQVRLEGGDLCGCSAGAQGAAPVWAAHTAIDDLLVERPLVTQRRVSQVGMQRSTHPEREPDRVATRFSQRKVVSL